MQICSFCNVSVIRFSLKKTQIFRIRKTCVHHSR